MSRRALVLHNSDFAAQSQHRIDGVKPALFADIMGRRNILNGRRCKLSDIFGITSDAGKIYTGPDGYDVTAGANELRIDHSFGVPELLDVGAYTQEIWPSRHTLGFWYRNEAAYDPAQTMISCRGDAIQKIVPTTATGLKFARPCNNQQNYVSGQPYTFVFDIFIPEGDITGTIILESPSLTIFNAGAWGSTLQNTINAKAGTYTGGLAGISIRRVGPMFRVVKTVTAIASGLAHGFPAIYWSNYGPSTGDGTSGYFIDRSMCVLGTGELPYIESVSGTVSVTADRIELTPEAYAVLAGAAGAVAARGIYPKMNIPQDRLVAYGTNEMCGPKAGSNTQVASWNGSTEISATRGGAGLWTTGFGVVGSWGVNKRSVCMNGGAVTEDATGRGTASSITIGPAAGMQAGQIIRLRQLLGWALADRGTTAQVQAQARVV